MCHLFNTLRAQGAQAAQATQGKILNEKGLFYFRDYFALGHPSYIFALFLTAMAVQAAGNAASGAAAATSATATAAATAAGATAAAGKATQIYAIRS